MMMHSCICQSYSDIFTILGWSQLFREEAVKSVTYENDPNGGKNIQM